MNASGSDTTDVQAVFDLIERLVARGYTCSVTVRGEGFSLTMQGQPPLAPAEPS